MQRLPIVLLIVIVSFPASALLGDLVVYDNGIGGSSGVSNGFRSDIDDTIPPLPNGLIVADDFVLSSDTNITRAKWSGVYDNLGTTQLTDDFTLAIYSDSGGVPSGLIFQTSIGDNANRMDSGFVGAGGTVYEYSAAIPNLSLDAGVTYWLSIYANTDGFDYDWFWGTGILTNEFYSSEDVGLSWTTRSNVAVDFQLLTVPEPNAATLIILVNVVALLYRRDRPS